MHSSIKSHITEDLSYSIIVANVISQNGLSPSGCEFNKILLMYDICIQMITIVTISPRARNSLIKWLRPKGLKVCSYVEKCAELKNQTL